MTGQLLDYGLAVLVCFLDRPPALRRADATLRLESARGVASACLVAELSPFLAGGIVYLYL